MEYLTFRSIEASGIAHALYTTMGTGNWRLNEPADLKNYEELGRDLNITPEHMVRTRQLHTSGVYAVTEENAGEGVTRDVTFEGYDGLVTNIPGLMLCTVEADCVPVYLLDPVHHAIGMIHSGWKGTCGLISANAVRLMHEKYGTRPEDMIAATGPCICSSCYEVTDDLIPPFEAAFGSAEARRFFTARDNGRYLLDLKMAIRKTLTMEGIREDNIEDSGYCTYHSGKFYSWRRDADPDVRMLTAIVLV